MAAFPTIFASEEKIFKWRDHGFQNISCKVLEILTSGRKKKQNSNSLAFILNLKRDCH